MNHQKFELKVDLAKLDVEVDKTSIFKVQMRIIGVFKVFSKKYQITQPEEFVNSTKKFHGRVCKLSSEKQTIWLKLLQCPRHLQGNSEIK